MHRPHANPPLVKTETGIPVTDGQGHPEATQHIGPPLHQRTQGERGVINQGMEDADIQTDDQGQTNVEGSISNVVGSGIAGHSVAQQVQSVQSKLADPNTLPPVDVEMKKEGMILQGNSTGSVMSNVVIRRGGMSLRTQSKKSNRMPGTKQCPSCQNTIAAAVAKCPKCPHVFREKKEKVKRSGKRGKKNCPKCSYENPSACSSCKQCKHVFRLKLMDKYKAMRPIPRQVSDTTVAAAAAAAQVAASHLHAQHANVPVSTVPMPAGVPSYGNPLGQVMHAAATAAAHGMPVMQPMAQHTMALPPHSHSLHPASMAQMHQQMPQHPMQPHQTHPQL